MEMENEPSIYKVLALYLPYIFVFSCLTDIWSFSAVLCIEVVVINLVPYSLIIWNKHIVRSF